jgi:C1A family cysteine protease
VVLEDKSFYNSLLRLVIMEDTTYNGILKEIQTQKASWSARDHEFLKLPKEKRIRRLGVELDEENLKQLRSRPRPDIVKLIAEAKSIGSDDILNEQVFEIFRNWSIVEAAVDWRNRHGQNNVTLVKDQGDCRSCVAFGTAATLESMLLIEHALSLDLSEAELYFCGGRKCSGPSSGWWPDEAVTYLNNNGLSGETCFPYEDHDMSCNTCYNRHPVHISNDTVLWDINQRKQYIRNVGPMMCVFEVFTDFYAYASGTYSHVTGGSEGLHCVEVIGFHETEGYWICKNSWGGGWGDNGFFNIKYGQCSIDSTYPFWGIGGTYFVPDWKHYKAWRRVFKWEIVQRIERLLEEDPKFKEKIIGGLVQKQ